MNNQMQFNLSLALLEDDEKEQLIIDPNFPSIISIDSYVIAGYTDIHELSDFLMSRNEQERYEYHKNIHRFEPNSDDLNHSEFPLWFIKQHGRGEDVSWWITAMCNEGNPSYPLQQETIEYMIDGVGLRWKSQVLKYASMSVNLSMEFILEHMDAFSQRGCGHNLFLYQDLSEEQELELILKGVNR